MVDKEYPAGTRRVGLTYFVSTCMGPTLVVDPPVAQETTSMSTPCDRHGSHTQRRRKALASI